ncbi:MAG: glycosyltransferase family 4 protein [Alphaproteobacteria bacterium]|nr:glycosyltransferase family 4 protein [Alphaproteobacteria bacterium]
MKFILFIYKRGFYMVAKKKTEPVVLQVLPELEMGGVELGTIEIASELQNQGIKNFVASQGGRLTKELQKMKVKHLTLPLKTKNIFKMRKNADLLADFIKKNGINIVHARSRAPAWSAYWAAKKAGVHYMTTFHGTYGLGPWGIKKLYNRIMTWGERVVVISNHIKNHVLQNYKVEESKLRLVHRCVDIDKFNPEKVSQERIIKAVQEYNIPDDRPVITLIGRVTRWKGQHLLVEALSKMKNKNYYCIIAGDEQGRVNYVNEIKSLAEKYRLKNRIGFYGKVLDPQALMQVSTVVLSTAIEPEAFGRISVEGQAMGKIVVASDIGGSLDTIKDEKTGKLFKSGNAYSLATALDWALKLDEENKKKIVKAAQKNVKDNFTKQIMCDKTIAVYRELVEI